MGYYEFCLDFCLNMCKFTLEKLVNDLLFEDAAGLCHEMLNEDLSGV